MKERGKRIGREERGKREGVSGYGGGDKRLNGTGGIRRRAWWTSDDTRRKREPMEQQNTRQLRSRSSVRTR